MLRAVDPSLSAAQLRYLAVVLDVDGDGRVSLADFRTTAQRFAESGCALRANERLRIEDVLVRMAQGVRKREVSLVCVCAICDATAA